MVLVCKEGMFKQRSHNSILRITLDYRPLYRLKPASCLMCRMNTCNLTMFNCSFSYQYNFVARFCFQTSINFVCARIMCKTYKWPYLVGILFCNLCYRFYLHVLLLQRAKTIVLLSKGSSRKFLMLVFLDACHVLYQ